MIERQETKTNSMIIKCKLNLTDKCQQIHYINVKGETAKKLKA